MVFRPPCRRGRLRGMIFYFNLRELIKDIPRDPFLHYILCSQTTFYHNLKKPVKQAFLPLFFELSTIRGLFLSIRRILNSWRCNWKNRHRMILDTSKSIRHKGLWACVKLWLIQVSRMHSTSWRDWCRHR